MGKTYVKINSELNDLVKKQIISKIEGFEGVVSVKIGSNILDYEISEWASDYDVMVMILNSLEEMGLDSEPVFDGEEEIAFDHSSEHCHEHHDCSHEHDCDDENECGSDCCCHGEHEHHHEHGHEHGVSCGCSSSSTKKERKIKGIELIASLVVLIVGIILKNIESTSIFANYVLVIAYSIAGYEVIFEGLISIFKGKPFSENTLMTIASLAAILLGEVVEAVGIMFLFSLGELFEHAAIADADKIIEKLKSYKDEKVKVLSDGIIKIVNPEKVKIGDIIVVSVGEKNVIDGEIIEGSATFDTKVITGESVYKDLTISNTVLGGFVCADGMVKIKATKTYSDSAVSKICEAVKDSAKKKSKTESFLEKFAKWFTPVVVIGAILLTFIPPIFSSSYVDGLKVWGLRAVMLLCVSCPCSLVISIPLAYYTGVGNLAKHGLIIKNSAIFDKIKNLKNIVYDKTGTLTDGTLKVTKIISTKKYQGEVLKLVSLCEKYSNHPIAVAIRQKTGEIDGEITNYVETPGKGISCEYNSLKLLCGNENFLLENGVLVTKNNDLGVKLYLSVNGEYAGTIILQDTIRKTARGSILELRDLGVSNIIMLTGDNNDYAEAVREQLGITKAVSNLLPQDKVIELEKVLAESTGTTMFIGDGVNDAPSLTRSDVGVAIGNGTDVAIESADIVLTNGDLSKIPYLVNIATRTSKIAKFNAILSLVIKFVVMLLSVLGLSTSLWLAIGADVGLLVVTIIISMLNRL